jgi:hypothetical protein
MFAIVCLITSCIDTPNEKNLTYTKSITGKSYYDAQCLGCHGDTTNSSDSYGSLNTYCKECEKSKESLAKYISETMPKGKGGLCDGDCSVKTAEYILSNIYKKNQDFDCENIPNNQITSTPVTRLTVKQLKNTAWALRNTLIPAMSLKNDKYPNFSEDIRSSFELPVGGLKSNDQILYQVYLPKVYSDFDLKPIIRGYQGIQKYAGKLEVIKQIKSGKCLLGERSNSLKKYFKVTRVCFDSFIKDKGKFILRSEVTQGVLDTAWDAFHLSGNHSTDERIGFAWYSVMLNPQHFHHITLGKTEPIENETKYELSNIELANKINFLFLDKPIASHYYYQWKRGDYDSEENLNNYLSSMFNFKITREKMGNKFVKYWLNTERPKPERKGGRLLDFFIDETTGKKVKIDPKYYFPKRNDETINFYRYIVYGEDDLNSKRRTFKDLFLDKSHFVSDPVISNLLYNTSGYIKGRVAPKVKEAQKGILNRSTFLQNSEINSNIIQRGVDVLKNILCKELDLPSAKDVAQRLSAVHLDPLLHSNRDVVEKMTSEASCMACHSQINPIGFALENLDMLGRVKLKEKIWAADGSKILNTLPLNSNGKILVDNKILKLSGSADLANYLSESKQAKYCFSKRIYEFVYRHNSENEQGSCRISKVSNQMNNKKSLHDSILELIGTASTIKYNRIPINR